MKVRRSWTLVALVVVAFGAATAVASASKPGWEIKRSVSGGPYTAIDTARRCGSSMLGTYTVRLADTYKSGALAGKTVRVVVTFALLDDHRLHRFRFVSATGTAISSLSPADRRSLDHALASSFSKYSIEVLDVLPGSRLKTRLEVKGKVVSTGDLALAQTSC